jgi:hypothetical protein
MRVRFRLVVCLCALTAAGTPAFAAPQELVQNGGFTNGGVGWQAALSGNGGWFVDTVGTTLPRSGLLTAAAGGGAGMYAVSDMTNAGIHALIQTISVPLPVGQVLLRFDMFVNDWASTQVFDILQHARVDVVAMTAPLPFAGMDPDLYDTTAGVLASAYIGTDGGPLPNDFTHYEIDITDAVRAGGQFRLRFLTVARLNVLNQGVDNVSVLYVPEGGSGGLAAAGMCAMAPFIGRAVRRRARKCAASRLPGAGGWFRMVRVAA